MSTDGHPAEARYVYSKLPSSDHTRVLEIYPSEDPIAEIRCAIHTFGLYSPDAISYEAISYTWGEQLFLEMIWVIGSPDGPNQIPITTNLSNAIRRFRYRTKPRFLWADAVCINQKDNDEKATHIPLMTDIYRGAARVVVWLGAEQKDQQNVLRINNMGRLIKSERRAEIYQEGKLLECMTDLLRLPWFSRRWIIQEVVMSTDVVLFCGSQRLSFLRLVMMLHSFRDTAIFSVPAARGLLRMYELWKGWATSEPHSSGREVISVLDLLQDFDHCGCVDGRDRIFTLASLSEDVYVHTTADVSPKAPRHCFEVLIDYGVSVEETYISTAQMFSNSKCTNWILVNAAIRSRGVYDTGLPSWVPDWRVPACRQPLSRLAPGHHIVPSREPADSTDYISLHRMNLHKTEIRRLSNTKFHLLTAGFLCIQDWRQQIAANNKNPNRGQYYDGPRCQIQYSTWAGKSEKKPPVPRDKNGLAPLAVTWKGETLSESGDNVDIMAWVQSTFEGVWKRVRSSHAESSFISQSIPPEGIKLEQNHDEGDIFTPGGKVWDECIDKFAYLITGYGKTSDKLDSMLLKAIEDMRESADSHERYRISIHEGRDIDLLRDIGYRARYKSSKYYHTARVQDIVLGKKGNLPEQDKILKLIGLRMGGRCLFTCEVDWKPERALAADIMGIGVPHMKTGDRVIFPAFEGGDFNWWKSTLLVREAILDAQTSAEISKDPEFIKARDQQFPPPVYQFVGECFLTASRWMSLVRGLVDMRWIEDTPGGYFFHEHNEDGRRNLGMVKIDVVLV
ncbi:heterokaryon incompatibility protein-domain-containing protein [Durotheca rogersii]|uniref:heterokaryon incompatibility protein-domain-containing protein n=1 Tax=Durotheca rogersii TaxID=419775 RepID=UPI00221EE7E9|nr:heterokaryon incompatibility protein-domain-containing protein [Durotheca rogersii]KAI5861031.1 heterokaryon incompatibility protein-domain-containing protein [Durotheca rogersii]